MRSESAWEKLNDGKTYKVYKDRGSWLFPYTVTAPSGRVITITSTMWGARRAIRKHEREQAEPAWWDAPVVAEVPKERPDAAAP